MRWLPGKQALPPRKPLNPGKGGQIRLRIPPSIHRLLSYRAETENLSLNQYMAMTLAKAVGHYSKPKKPVRRKRATNETEVKNEIIEKLKAQKASPKKRIPMRVIARKYSLDIDAPV